PPAQSPPHEDAWLSRPHEDEGWPQDIGRASEAWPQAPHRLLGQVAGAAIGLLASLTTASSRSCPRDRVLRAAGPRDPAMSDGGRERIARHHRLRTGSDYAAVKQQGRALRGRRCLVLMLERPGA